MSLSYVFMGSPSLARICLEAVTAGYGPPKLVITQTAKAQGRGQRVIATAVENLAKERGYPLVATDNINTGADFERLRAASPDIILVAAFGQLLKEEALKLPKLFCLNVHASLLPRYRGASPIQRAIWEGNATTGITIQKMVRKLDAGDSLLQKPLTILPEETSAELGDRLARLGGEALVESLRLIESGKYSFTPQDESCATYAPKISKEDARIDWKEPAERIRNQIRALQPWPVAETVLGRDRLKIFGGVLTPGVPGKTAGDIATDQASFLHVQCGDGQALSLTQIQLESRKQLEIQDFLRAYRGKFPFSRMGA